MHYSFLSVMLILTAFTTGAYAQSAEEQCQMIAALSSDFYQHRQEGKTLEELRQDTPAEFIGTDFARTIELALMLAFTMDESLTEDQLETQVFDSCLRNNPQ
jgi:hypothetical protein